MTNWIGGDIGSRYLMDISQSLNALNTLQAAATASAMNTNKVVASQYGRMNKQLAGHAKTSAATAQKLKATWWARFGTVALGFTIAYRALNVLEAGVRRVVEIIGEAIKESGALASVQAKLALWTTMHSKGVVTYAEAFTYARGSMLELMRASVTSLSSIEELSTGLDEMGQTLGLVRKETVKSAVDLVDFTVLVAQTTGSVTRQVRQEIQSLLQGQIRTTDIVIRTMRKMGVITDEDIMKLKKQIDVQKTFDKVLQAVSEHMKEFRREVLATDVTKALAYWEKSLRVVMVESTLLASALEDVGNIFAKELVVAADEYREGLSNIDWARNIEFMYTLRDVLVLLIRALEKTIQIMSMLGTAVRNTGDAWDGLSKGVQTGLKIWLGFAAVGMATRIIYTFGKAVNWLVLGPLLRLGRLLTVVAGRIVLIPVLIGAVGVAIASLAKILLKAEKDMTSVWDIENFWVQFKEGFLGIVSETGGFWADFFKPLTDVFNKLFSDLFTPDADIIAARINMMAQEIVADIRGIDYPRTFKAADPKDLKKYSEEIAKMAIEYKVLAQTLRAVKKGVLDISDIGLAQDKLEAYFESLKVPPTQQDYWLWLKNGIIDTKELQSDLLDQDELRKDLAKDLAKLRKTEHNNEIFLLNLRVQEMRKVAGFEKDILEDIETFRIASLEKLADEYSLWGRNMINMSQRTAEAIEQTFSDFWFDVFTTKLNNLGDIIEAFLNSVLRAVSDVAGQITAELIMGRRTKAGGLTGGFVGWLGSLIGLHKGGILHEPVIGRGLQSGRTYALAEHGPERISPIGGGASTGTTNVIIQNFSGEKTEQKKRRNTQGGEDILVVIGKSFANDIRNAGPIHRQMRDTFGLYPAIQGR